MTDKQFLVYLMAKRARLMEARRAIAVSLPEDLSVTKEPIFGILASFTTYPALEPLDDVISELTDEIEALSGV